MKDKQYLAKQYRRNPEYDFQTLDVSRTRFGMLLDLFWTGPKIGEKQRNISKTQPQTTPGAQSAPESAEGWLM